MTSGLPLRRTASITRRAFLQGVAGGAAVATLGGRATAGRQRPARKIRGVALGGWLVLEEWITPSLFAGRHAQDEWGLCQELGPEAAARLEAHRESWVGEADFAWIKAHGLNAVRLPVGYWALEKIDPYVPCARHLDRAFAWAAKHGLDVLVDLHGAPGSQNGWPHSGRSGEVNWHRDPRNVARTLDVIEALASHCQGYKNLLGIELLNEPRWDIPMTILRDFYEKGYERVRRHVPARGGNRGLVVLHDAFLADAWDGFMHEPAFRGVAFDQHLYHCFDPNGNDARTSAADQTKIAAGPARHAPLDRLMQQLPTFVGEWSLLLNSNAYQGLDGAARARAKRAFAQAQLDNYGRAAGWFFWCYKTEGPVDRAGPSGTVASDANLRECVGRGWLPANLART